MFACVREIIERELNIEIIELLMVSRPLLFVS